MTERAPAADEFDLYRQALDQAEDPIAVVDSEDSFEVLNRAFEELTGYDATTLRGTDPTTVLHESAEHDWRQRIQLLREDQQDETEEWVARFCTNHGAEIPVEVNLSVLRTDEGSYQGVVCRARDVRKQSQQKQQLDILNRALRHNIRNHMNIAIIHARSLQDLEDPDKRTAASEIETVAQEVINLSNKARKAQEYMTIPADEDCQMDLVSATADVIQTFEIQYPGATVRTDLPEAASALAPPSYEVALDELLENAVIHHESGEGPVTVRIESEDDQHTVHIGDECEPIPEDVIQTIRHGSELPLQHNEGLGLWIVRWMVDIVNAEVSFERRADDEGNDVQLRFDALE